MDWIAAPPELLKALDEVMAEKEQPQHLPGNQTRHKDLPDIHFGEVEDEPGEDDDLPYVKGHNDDNDEKQEKTDQDVIDILGFDPLEFDTDE